MPKSPISLKLLIAVSAIVIGVASVVSFAYFWPSRHTFKLSGEVQAREIQDSSRYGGRVRRILVKEGDKVKQGQPLILLDDTDLQAKIADAKATLDQAMAQEKMLLRGADSAQLHQASASVEQAEEHFKMLSSPARPEEIAQAQSRLQAAQSQLNQARKNLENAKLLLDSGIISKQKYDNLETAVSTAQDDWTASQAALKLLKSRGRPEERKTASAQVAAAQAQYHELKQGSRPEEINIAKANIEKATSDLHALQAHENELSIRAPFSGYISVIGINEGEFALPGRPLITILDYGDLWSDFFVPESHLSAIQLGKTVVIHARAYKNKTFDGHVVLVNPKSEFIPNSGGDNNNTEESTFRVKVAVHEQDQTGHSRLYPGMKIDGLFVE